MREVDQVRRGMLKAGVAVGGIGAVGAGSSARASEFAGVASTAAGQRALDVYLMREAAARNHLLEAFSQPPQLGNTDEASVLNYAASYTKGLQHNSIGEVDPVAYRTYLAAVRTGTMAAFEAIPLASGAQVKLANPMAAYCMELHGTDSAATRIRPAPEFLSPETAAEMVEVYWQALTRDVPFADYASNSSIAAAVGDLNNKTHQIGPVVGGRLTSASLFRGTSAGDLTGPYISQFLLKDIPYGPTSIAQRYKQPVAGSDYMKVWEEYLAIQNGRLPTRADVLDATPRYIYNGRALANWVHSDFSYQAFLNAALIALGYGRGALSSTNPYLSSANQGNFIDFGGPDILNQVAMAARVGLAGAWFQKWQVHRRLRPEVMAARAEIDRGLPEPRYLVHGEIANSVAASRLLSAQGNILLPMAFPEGSPTHPAYPAGHAAIAGACTTVLKAFFNPDFTIPNPVQASRDGTALEAINTTVKLGDELDKLASNISIGRDTAGVHYRSDGIEGMLLGEQVGIGLLRDYSLSYPESFDGYLLRRFDGSNVRIRNGVVTRV